MKYGYKYKTKNLEMIQISALNNLKRNMLLNK